MCPLIFITEVLCLVANLRMYIYKHRKGDIIIYG